MTELSMVIYDAECHTDVSALVNKMMINTVSTDIMTPIPLFHTQRVS
jgi:hypothetical protein